MEFEYDPEKSRINASKHGIDFLQAQRLWRSTHVDFAAISDYENRFALIGVLHGKHYTCIYTLRGTRIRLISCRRSRPKEVAHYEKVHG